jgi:AraC-like DNA-binding protein
MVSVVPVLITGYLIYNRFESIYSEELQIAEATKTDSFSKMYLQQLNALRYDIGKYRANELLYPNEYSSDRFNKYIIYNNLIEIKSTNQYIYAICYVYDHYDVAILSNYGSVSSEDAAIKNLVSQITATPGIKTQLIISDDLLGYNQKSLYFVIKLDGADINIFFQIDVDLLTHSLIDQFGIDTYNQQLMILHSNYELLFATKKVNEDREHWLDFVKNFRVGEDTDNNYIVTSSLLEGYEGINIYSIVDNHEYNQKINKLKTRIYFVMAIILFLLIITILLLVKILYKPIGKATQFIKHIFRSPKNHTGNEFDIIMETLEKAAERIYSLSMDVDDRDENVKRTIIQAQLAISQKLQANQLKYFETAPDYVTVVLIDILNEDDILTHNTVAEKMAELFSANIFIDEHGLICVIWTDYSETRKLMSQLDDLIIGNPSLHDRICVTAGKTYDTVEKVRMSYVQALYTMDTIKNNIDTSENIALYSDIATNKNERMNYSAGDLLAVNYVKKDDDKIIDIVKTELDAQKDIIDKFTFILSAYNIILSNSNKEERIDIINELNSLLDMNRIKNSSEIDTVLLKYLINGKSEKSRELAASHHITDIKNYIEANYGSDIPLDTLSAFVGVTPQYVCSLIKKHTGMSFTHYINEVRIEKAKILILEGVDKVDELYKKVGFNSHSYFSKVFKSITGLSPSTFINRYS